MFQIDPTDPTPAEVQLVRTIRSAIAAGLLEPGDALPTVRHLAVELKVGANAVARAYAELERQGVLASRARVGVVVKASPAELVKAENDAALGELEDDFLRRASELGYSLDDVIIHLDSRRGSENADVS